MRFGYNNMRKLVFVVPKLNKGEATHFAYFPDFITEISENFKVKIIIERGSWPADFFLLRLLWARVSGYRDFYVHYSFRAALVASIIAGFFGGRVFYWNCGEPWKYKRNFWRESLERRVYKMITYLVTGAETLAIRYSEHYGIPREKIKIMPNWIDLEKIKYQILNIKNEERERIKDGLKIPENQKIILFAHRLSERKGAHYLPEILKKLDTSRQARGIPPVVLLIAGDGPERKSVESKIKDYGLSDRARFLGWVPQEEIVK